MRDKPFSPASERNRVPILDKLRPLLVQAGSILEIGSGTGQHAVFFGEHMPHLVWQTSDLIENHAGIGAWLEDAGLANVRPPLTLNVDANDWPELAVDAVYTANTMHIMSFPSVSNMIAGVAGVLDANGLFCAYGPFSYDGRHTSESNARFDLSLRSQDPNKGIRQFEQVRDLALASGLSLEDDYGMPANNRMLVFRKK